MRLYAKIFGTIFTGTLANDPDTRHLFMDLLVLAEPDGTLDMTYESIAAVTRVPLRRVRSGIEKLMMADPGSRRAEHEGRRLVPLDGRGWGWLIVNAQYYTMLQNASDRRAQTAERVRRYRERHRNAEVTPSNASNASNARYTETETYTETEKNKGIVPSAPRPTLEEVTAYCHERRNSVDPQAWLDHYTSNGWKVGRNPMKDWRAAVRTWERSGLQGGGATRGHARSRVDEEYSRSRGGSNGS